MISKSQLLIGTLACIWGFWMYANVPPTADEALEQVMSYTRSADLNATWRSYEIFFNHPDRNDIDGDTFLSCFRWSGCYHLDVLANSLGKSRAEIESLITGFCPHFTSWKLEQRRKHPYSSWTEERYERDFEETLKGLHWFSGYDKSCDDWASRIKNSVSAANVKRNTEATRWRLIPIITSQTESQTMDIGGTQDAYVQSLEHPWWPTVTYQIGDNIRNAVVDTGSSILLVEHDRTFPDDYFVRTHDEVIATGISSELHRVSSGFISEFRISNISYIDMSAVKVPTGVFRDHLQDIIGMSLLLQYDDVCFSWNERQLYLGDAGPCKHGFKVEAGLQGNGQLFFPIRINKTSQKWFAMIDTGSDISYCAPDLLHDAEEIDTNGGELRFHIDQISNVEGLCELDESARQTPKAFAYLDPSPVHAVIGLNTLHQFSAFGWSKAPLEVYLVPK